MANAKESRSVKNNIGLALFILILVAMFFIPTSETLTAAGRNSLGLLLATIVCMLTGGLPIGVLYQLRGSLRRSSAYSGATCMVTFLAKASSRGSFSAILSCQAGPGLYPKASSAIAMGPLNCTST